MKYNPMIDVGSFAFSLFPLKGLAQRIRKSYRIAKRVKQIGIEEVATRTVAGLYERGWRTKFPITRTCWTLYDPMDPKGNRVNIRGDNIKAFADDIFQNKPWIIDPHWTAPAE